MYEYRAFRYNVSKYSKNIKCPLCDNETMKLSDFEDHCINIHDLDSSVLCVFCRNFYWDRGQKVPNGPHLYECLKRFINRNNVSVAHLELPTKASTPPETICPCASFRSDDLRRRTKQIPEWTIREILNGGVHLMYEPMFTSNNDDWCSLPNYDNLLIEANENEKFLALLNPLKFHSWSGLDDAVKWIHRYIYHEKRLGWFHVCVRAGCMKSFVECLQGHKIVELPYGCVCRGRENNENCSPEALRATWKHHRHAIVVVENKFQFKRCLEKNIHYGTGEIPENGKRYYCAEIKDVNHFISTIAYVSLPKCTEMETNVWCDYSPTQFETLNRKQIVDAEGLNDVHYYIFKPVIPHAIIWMLLVVPDALERYCKFRVGPRSVYKMDSKVKCNGQWYVSACEEIGIRNCPVLFDPIDMRIGDVINPSDMLSHVKNYQSTDRWFVYWFGGKVLKVTKFDDGPSRESFNDFQHYCFENKINTMFNFRKNLFLLSHQRHANDLHLLENQMKIKYEPQINQLENEQERLKNKYNALEIEWKNKYDLQEKKWLDDQEINLKNKLDDQEKILCDKNNIHLNQLREIIQQLTIKLETQSNINCEEFTKKRKLETDFQNYKNKFEKCFGELEAIKKEFKTLKESEKRELKDYKKKLDISEAKFEKFKNEKYLPLLRDLHNTRRREKRLKTKK